MFLKYLSVYDYDEKYWGFILRFETIVAGIVSEMAKRSDLTTKVQIATTLSQIFANCFDKNSGTLPPNWWDNVCLPSYLWFDDYLQRELPLMITEIQRLRSKNKETRTENKSVQVMNLFDKDKIHRLAHQSPSFHRYLVEQVPIET